jgi:hypothetical protein
MSELQKPENSAEEIPRGREGNWALPVKVLKSSQIQADINLNVDGKEIAGPLRGFGQLWKKTYTIPLHEVEVSPQEVIRIWKEHFGSFWPNHSHFYGSPASIEAGEVAVLNLPGPGGINYPGGKSMLSTGVLVIYVDEVSFSFMTPYGHIFAGMVTFSAHEDEDATVAQVELFVRASDPLYEIGARLGMVHKMEDDHWHFVLKKVAERFGVKQNVTQQTLLLDPRLQWSLAGNVRHNAVIHTGVYLALSPLRWAKRRLRRAHT